VTVLILRLVIAPCPSPAFLGGGGFLSQADLDSNLPAAVPANQLEEVGIFGFWG